MEKAAEFEQMAGATQDPVLQARFSSIAGCYRLLAREREWLIEIGAIENQPAARRPRRGTMGLLRRSNVVPPQQRLMHGRIGMLN
jgi:hypothetical protein